MKYLYDQHKLMNSQSHTYIMFYHTSLHAALPSVLHLAILALLPLPTPRHLLSPPPRLSSELCANPHATYMAISPLDSFSLQRTLTWGGRVTSIPPSSNASAALTSTSSLISHLGPKVDSQTRRSKGHPPLSPVNSDGPLTDCATAPRPSTWNADRPVVEQGSMQREHTV